MRGGHLAVDVSVGDGGGEEDQAVEKRARFRNRVSDHINVSEAKAYVAEVLRASWDPEEHKAKRFYGLDSLVLVGARVSKSSYLSLTDASNSSSLPVKIFLMF